MSYNNRFAINAHLELSYRVHRAATEIFYNLTANKDLIYASNLHSIELSALKFKINILQQIQDYLEDKSKFYKAVNNDFVSNNVPSDNAARNNGVDLLTLFEESMKCLCLKLNKQSYSYDKLLEKNGIFTFKKDSLLLQELDAWKNRVACKCFCVICALEQLQSIAYCFAQQKRKHPETWLKCRKADLSWLYHFMIKYTVKISNNLKNAIECKIDGSTSQFSSSIFDEDNLDRTFEISDLLEDESLQTDINVDINERMTMRQKIKKHLEVSERLDNAAKKILSNVNKSDIKKIANKCKLDHVLLTSKVNILKRKRETYETKCKLESAINDIIFNSTSIPRAALKHDIDEATLTMEITQEWQNKSETGIYVYDALTIDDTGLFTFSEEYILLKRLLHLQPVDLNQNCNCRICLLEYLSKLAYEFAKKNNKPCPFEWNRNEKADITWLLEFEMRHSIEIAKYNHECEAKEN